MKLESNQYISNMPKKLKFNKDTQYYIDMSTEMILDRIKEDASNLDILGRKKDSLIKTSLESGVYVREFDETGYGGIEIVTLGKLDQYAEYLMRVTLPVDEPSFKVVEGGMYDICVNKVILGQGYDLCDISSIDELGIKVTKDIVRQIGKKDRVDTLQALLDSNRIKKAWGNIVLEWANKVETLEWANGNLTCNQDESDPSLGEAFYTAFLDGNMDKIRWLLEHEFEIGEISVDQLKHSLETGRIDIFEMLKQHNALEGIELSRTLAVALKHNQFDLSEWLLANLESEDQSKDIGLAIIRTFGDYDSDRLCSFGEEKHYYNKLTPEVFQFLIKHNTVLDKDTLTTVFLNACEHNIVSNIEYLFDHYDVMNNSDIKNEAIGIASKYSSIDVFTILTNKFGNNSVDIYEAVYNASVTGNIAILNQLYDFQKEAFMKVMNRKDFDSSTAILKKYKNHAELILSESTANIEVLKWYRANGLFSVPVINLFDLAFSKGQVDTMSWLESEYKPDYTKHFNDRYYHINHNYRIMSRQTRRQKLLAQSDDSTDDESCPIIRSLQWLKDRNFVFNSNFKKELFELEHINIFNKSNELLDWLKVNILVSSDIPRLAKEYRGEHSYMKDRLNWMLKNYPEHSDIINIQLKKTRTDVDTDEATIDDYGDESSTKSGRKSRVPQCAQS